MAEGLQAAGIEPEVTQLTKLPQTTSEPAPTEAGKILRLLEALEDLDDVQNVYTTASLEGAAELA